MRKIFLFFAAILCAMSVQGANTMRIYCKQAQSWWKSDNAAVGAYYWGTGGNANSWPGTRMTKVSGQTDLWYIDVDIDKYQNIIFTRVPGSGSVSDWGAKTNDLTINNTKNQYTITQSTGAWNGAKSSGTWGTYKPTSTAALATSAANIFVGGQATLTSSLTSNTDANTIKETAYTISPAGANVSGNTFTATAEGTYTVTATVTYYPLGCPTLTSTATATTTITAAVPAEEVHDVTVSYMCGGEGIADATTVLSVGVETPVKVTAPEIAKYTFANWTLGVDVATTDALTSNAINITTKEGGSDFTLLANYEKAKLTYTVTVPAGTENCYLVGAMNGWDVANPIEMTKQGENVFTTTLEGVATTDEYKYISQKGSWDYADVQESNRTWSANDVVTAWKDPLATNVYLVGSMFANWDKTPDKEFRKTTKDATTASIVVALDANTDYELKVRRGDDWTSCTSKITNTVTGLQFSSSNGDNCKMKTTVAGEYTFTWTISSSKLDVTYPTLYEVTATANDAAMGTVAGAGNYGKGSTATLTATPNDGYLFVNWTKGGVEVATTQEYSFIVTEAVELVANFKKHETTIHCVPAGDLAWYLGQALPGDTLLLADGTYDESGSIDFNKENIVVMAAEGAKPVIALTGEYTALNVSASTTFDGITFDGTNVAKYIIATLDSVEMDAELTITNCEFKNWEYWAISNQYEKNVSVNSVVIDNCLFHDGAQSAISFSNKAPEGKHACNYFKLTNSTIYNVKSTEYAGIIHVSSNGEATGMQNTVIIDHVTMYNLDGADLGIIAVRKSSDLTISNTIIANSAEGERASYVYGGVAENVIYYNVSQDGDLTYTNCLNVDPLFVDADNGNFELMPLSPARGAATDGGDLGDPRWYTSVTKYTVTATANPAEAGTITGAGEYTEGKEVTLVATPAHGYNFVNWTKGEEVVAETAEYTFTASANVELVANFEEKAFTGNIINVEPGEGTLATAVENAEAGDKLVLADGTYTQEYSINMDKAGLIITAAENAKPVIQLTGEWTTLNVSASTTFEGITFDANNVAKYIIATLDSVAMTTDLVIYNCEFKNWLQWAISNQYAKNVSAKSVVIDNCLFHDGTNSAIRFSENAPEGKNACQYLEVSNSTFHNIGDANAYSTIYSLARTDAEAAASNEVVVNHCTFYNCQAKNTDHAAVRVSYTASISNTIIVAPEAQSTYRAIYAVDYSNAQAINCLTYNYTKDTGGIRSAVTKTNCLNVDPLFVDAANGNFNLLEGSPAIGAATDGSNLGDPRWVVSAPLEPETYTVTATATNGTVTGAGTYNHGEEVTLTATPAFDYQFVKWSNESTENPLTITVEDNIELEAIFAEVAATEKKESGVFSISAHKTATFATGNLQYHIGNKTWRFAKQQYQVVGEQNINLGDPAFTGWIDMLGWSNGDANNYGVNPSNVNELYDGEFVDWGTKMGEGWSTLSAEEWSYLLNTRENAASLKQTAKVDTILGILLFPDGWVMPEDVVVEAEMDEYFEVNIYNYTLEQWTKLEQAGALFLPAAGRRAGGYGNMINYYQVEETNPENLNGGFYRHQDNTNIYCYYWTSTINAESKVSYLHNVLALGNDEYTIGNGAIWSEKGRYGQSVRLAKVAYDKHTVTATAENGTVEGAGEYTHGTEITLTATPAEHYVFVNWTKGEEVVAETAEYTFTVEADVELVANFKLDSHTVAATAENGIVEGAGTYEHGAEVILTATANEGYEFVKWSNESTENPLTITVTEDVTISAIFQEVVPVITHTVTWYTAVGETTEVTLKEGVAITKPETNPEMEGYVFMGWTDECFVAEDGSDFTAIGDFGTADADKEYYAVFAVETTTDGGGDEIIEKSYTFSGYAAGTQYAENETHKLDNDVTIYTTQCHFTTQLRIYSSSTHDGYVISNQLPGNIISMSFNMGYKADNLAVYGSTDGSTWTEVGKVATTSDYKDYEISFGSTNYTYFKLDVAGSNQIRIAKMGIIYATAVSGEPTTTYSNYMTTCTPEEYTIEWSVNGKVTETTTVVEGDALVLPEAPAAPDACSEKVFMGWATTATVNAYGSAITWVNDTIVPEGDNTYYAVFATEIEEETNETYTKTATVNIADYATANSWGNDTQYTQVIIDKNITATAAGEENTGKYYTSGTNWRLYQTESATLTIDAAEGVTINNVIVTYSVSNYGTLTLNEVNIASKDQVGVNASSITFGVGQSQTAEKANGQARVTAIEVNYTFSGTVTTTTYTDYATICVVPEYTITFDYSKDAGYVLVNGERIATDEVTYKEGTVLTVKALTFNDWLFNAWEDEEQYELTTTPEYTFTVTGDVVLKAIFTPEKGAVGTGVENNNVVSSKTMKVIQNGRLMIIREGKIYNAQGQMIE